MHSQEQIRGHIGTTLFNLHLGRIKDFQGLLETFLQTRALRSLMTTNESVLQGLVEVLIDEPDRRITELRLVVDGTREKGDGRYGFVDLFLFPKGSTTGERTPGIALELKDITLSGLMKGSVGDWHYLPEYSEFQELSNALSNESEDDLLDRNYMYWSKKASACVMTTVGAIVGDAVKQLENYLTVIALGKPRSYNDSGVLNDLVRIVQGYDHLVGHVIVAIGGRRVFTRSVKPVQTKYEYRKCL